MTKPTPLNQAVSDARQNFGEQQGSGKPISYVDLAYRAPGRSHAALHRYGTEDSTPQQVKSANDYADQLLAEHPKEFIYVRDLVHVFARDIKAAVAPEETVDPDSDPLTARLMEALATLRDVLKEIKQQKTAISNSGKVTSGDGRIRMLNSIREQVLILTPAIRELIRERIA